VFLGRAALGATGLPVLLGRKLAATIANDVEDVTSGTVELSRYKECSSTNAGEESPAVQCRKHR